MKRKQVLWVVSRQGFRDMLRNDEVYGSIMTGKTAVISICDPLGSHDLVECDNILNVAFFDDDSITPEMAMKIANFINRNYDKHFLIHCSAGKSRSQGVARFIMDTYTDIDWVTNPENPCLTPNIDVVLRLKEAKN